MSKKWYIAVVKSNCEEKVRSTLEESISESGMKEYFSEVMVPTKIITDAEGKEKKINHHRGYVFLNMDLNDESWSLVKNTKHVSSILGSGRTPTAVPESQIKEIKKFLDSEESNSESGKFKEGEEVKIISGPFESFIGKVSSINEDKSELEVEVMVFGRPTPVKMPFSEIKK